MPAAPISARPARTSFTTTLDASGLQCWQNILLELNLIPEPKQRQHILYTSSLS